MKYAVLLPLLVSCTGCVKTDHPFKRCESTQITFHADTEFTDDEREDITKASREWFDATDGRADIRVVFDPNQLGGHIYREMRTVMQSETSVRAGLWNGFDVLLYPGAVPRAEFYPVVLHEFGHVLGIPGHPHPINGVMRADHSPMHWHLESSDLAAYAQFCGRGY